MIHPKANAFTNYRHKDWDCSSNKKASPSSLSNLIADIFGEKEKTEKGRTCKQSDPFYSRPCSAIKSQFLAPGLWRSHPSVYIYFRTGGGGNGNDTSLGGKNKVRASQRPGRNNAGKVGEKS